MTSRPHRPPDFVQYDGLRCWHDSNGLPHSENDQPAITRPGGEKIYYHHGVVHRDLGPAHIHADGREDWYHHGRKLDDAEVARLAEKYARKQAAQENGCKLLIAPRIDFKKRLP